MPYQLRIDYRLQHRRLSKYTRNSLDLHGLHWMCPSEAYPKAGATTGTMEPWTMGTSYQRLCFRLFRLCDSVFLLSQLGSSLDKHGQLGATGMGGGDTHCTRGLHTPWAKSLYSSSDFRGREKASGNWSTKYLMAISSVGIWDHGPEQDGRIKPWKPNIHMYL